MPLEGGEEIRHINECIHNHFANFGTPYKNSWFARTILAL